MNKFHLYNFEHQHTIVLQLECNLMRSPNTKIISQCHRSQSWKSNAMKHIHWGFLWCRLGESPSRSLSLSPSAHNSQLAEINDRLCPLLLQRKQFSCKALHGRADCQFSMACPKMHAQRTQVVWAQSNTNDHSRCIGNFARQSALLRSVIVRPDGPVSGSHSRAIFRQKPLR